MKVLFVCTANIHRSRFAEEVFNFLAKEKNSVHRAFSAGLKVGDYSFRTIYYPALNNLKKLNITPLRPNDYSTHIDDVEIREYDRIICMDEYEHKPMVMANANLGDEIFEYWNIVDEPKVKSDISLPKCFQKVEDLLTEIDT
tara:strand:+ start:667 stop:1092 length:426 start_codon:yes stop_codon:yes gene_type:complete